MLLACWECLLKKSMLLPPKTLGWVTLLFPDGSCYSGLKVQCSVCGRVFVVNLKPEASTSLGSKITGQEE